MKCMDQNRGTKEFPKHKMHHVKANCEGHHQQVQLMSHHNTEIIKSVKTWQGSCQDTRCQDTRDNHSYTSRLGYEAGRIDGSHLHHPVKTKTASPNDHYTHWSTVVAASCYSAASLQLNWGSSQGSRKSWITPYISVFWQKLAGLC